MSSPESCQSDTCAAPDLLPLPSPEFIEYPDPSPDLPPLPSPDYPDQSPDYPDPSPDLFDEPEVDLIDIL